MHCNAIGIIAGMQIIVSGRMRYALHIAVGRVALPDSEGTHLGYPPRPAPTSPRFVDNGLLPAISKRRFLCRYKEQQATYHYGRKNQEQEEYDQRYTILAGRMRLVDRDLRLHPQRHIIALFAHPQRIVQQRVSDRL